MNPLLRNILKPPGSPVDLPTDEDWQKFEREWCKLPADFKEFVSEYGRGCIDSFLWIFNPASRNTHGNLSEQFERQTEVLKTCLSDGLVEGISTYPDKGGVVPFGMSDNGDLLAWEANGDPDHWTVIVIPARDPNYQRFEMGFSDFLAAVLRREVSRHVFPDDFPGLNPDFRTPEQMKEFYRKGS